MKAIHVPRITANEDEVLVTEVAKARNAPCAAGEQLCLLESTKATFSVDADRDGHVYLLVEAGQRVTVGQVLGYVADDPIDPAALPAAAPAAEAAAAGELSITRKAAELLQAYGLRAEEIKRAGVLKAADVEAHLQAVAPEPTDPAYAELDRVMKDMSVDGVTVEDVERLKRTVLYAAEIYARRWHRRVPVLDVLFDRWAAGEAQGFGERSNISHLSYVTGDVKVGRNTFIGPFTIIDGSGGLEIGDHCSIAAGVHIYSHDTIGRALSGYEAAPTRMPTRIGNACFIGPHAVIAKGVTIGNHCFIGANSVVTFDVPSYTAVQGNPARVIGRVEVNGAEVRIVANR